LQLQPVKTNSLQPVLLPLPPFAMQQVKVLSFIAGKVIFVFVLQLQSVFQDFAILCQLAHR
jgi:hypothetical protein